MFAERLKSLRNEKGLTQTELADMLSFGRTAIANYESGRNKPDPVVLSKLAEIFDVTTDYLIGVSNVRKPKGITRFHLKDSMEVQDLPPEAIEEFENMLDYLHEKYKDKKKTQN